MTRVGLSPSSAQQKFEGIMGRAFRLRRRRAQFRRRANSMISRVRPNCRFGNSRSWRKYNATGREQCESEKSASKFVDSHFDSPYE
jgi:hypothetical protein